MSFAETKGAEDLTPGLSHKNRGKKVTEARIMAQHTIAVVGAGASGLAAVAAIAKSFTANPIHKGVRLTILWVDNKDSVEYGPGNVYLDHERALHLNVPARQMSIRDDDPEHFTRWINEQYPQQYSSTSFVPRPVYAEYLKHCAQSLITSAGDNITIVPTCANVEDIVANGQFKVFTGPKSYNAADQVVLAIGHMQGVDPFSNALDSQPNYFGGTDAEAYRRATSLIPSGLDSQRKNVFILGYGATAIDRIRLLDQIGYEGEITIVTRHGMRPWEYKVEHDGKNDYEMAIKPQDLIALAQEFTTADRRGRAAVIEKFVDALRHETDRAIQNGYGPQNFLYPNKIGALIDDAVRGEGEAFAAEAHKIVTLYRSNPTPPADAKRIKELEAEERLKIVIGEVNPNASVLEDGRIQVEYSPKDGQSVQGAFDAVFNGAPFARDYKKHPLLQKMVGAGHGTFDRDRGILAGDEDGRPRDMRQGIHVIGPFTKPTWGIEGFRKQAREIALQVMANMRGQVSHQKHTGANIIM